MASASLRVCIFFVKAREEHAPRTALKRVDNQDVKQFTRIFPAGVDKCDCIIYVSKFLWFPHEKFVETAKIRRLRQRNFRFTIGE